MMSVFRIFLFKAFLCLVPLTLSSQSSVVQVIENSPKDWVLLVDGNLFISKERVVRPSSKKLLKQEEILLEPGALKMLNQC